MRAPVLLTLWAAVLLPVVAEERAATTSTASTSSTPSTNTPEHRRRKSRNTLLAQSHDDTDSGSQNNSGDIESYYWKLYMQNNIILNQLRERYREENELFPRGHDQSSPAVIETPAWLEEETGCTSDKNIIEKLQASYKSFKTPSETGVDVWIEVWVQEVNAVNELASDFDMDIYVTELWIDQALKYDHLNPCKFNLSLNSEILDKIWKPNTVFINRCRSVALVLWILVHFPWTSRDAI
ncbi:unnamed protein product, partial [Mesorhabditis spiculigera]